MGISLDQVESLWPSYRGAVLAGMAQESQGRVTNARVAMTAGHLALSLDVHEQRDAPDGEESELGSKGVEVATTGADSTPGAHPSKPVEHNEKETILRPALRLTILLDAVPDSAPKPGVHQMAKFLTKVLAASEAGGRRSEVRSPSGDTVASNAASPGLEESPLGENVPEMLVVKHEEEVVSSQFIRCGHHHGPSLVAAAEGPASQAARSPTLVYACIEASGLLRLWKWESERGGWRWGYLNSCNICAFREDPVGCRVLTAVFAPEPDESLSRVGRGHRLLWEQEDHGEGAGLGLVFTPVCFGPSLPPRRVWSRRVTFDLDEEDERVSADQQFRQVHQEHQPDEGNDGLPGSGDGGGSEIGLAFSACVLPTGVDALLGSRLGAWMAAGEHVFFNDFTTGRLRETVLPGLDLYRPPPHGRAPGFNGGGSGLEGGVKLRCHGKSQWGSVPLTAESVPVEEPRATKEGIDSSGADANGVDGMGGFSSGTVANGEGEAEVELSPTRLRLFTVLDATGDLVMYDHPGAVRVVSLPSGDGNLVVSLRCTLHPLPPTPPRCLVVHRNAAVLADSGFLSAYDLCTGRLLGVTVIPQCPVCAVGRRRNAASAYDRSGSSCSCGRWRRRQPMVGGDPHRWSAADHDPTLWISETGHLMGILTASHLLRVRFPRADARVEAMLAPSPTGQQAPTALTVLRHLREYKRIVRGGDGVLPPTSFLPELFRYQELDTGVGHARMLEILRHALAAEERDCDKDGRAVPPWLLLALLSASQDGARRLEQAFSSPDGGRNGEAGTAEAGAAEEVRDTVERRVAESLRGLERVRALQQDRSLGGPSTGNGIPVAREIASSSAAVDPATPLFEGTLRNWLRCRRGQHEGLEIVKDDNREGVSTTHVGGRSSDEGGSPPVLDDVLALAFRCEIAGEVDAQETPFLRLVLEGSRHSSGEAPRRDDEGEDERSAREEAAFASSTFLCLHLAGDDSSPLFEVACRALFRLRPMQLPRFVERLSRFRAFADGIARDARGAENHVAAIASPSSSAASAAAVAQVDGTDEAIHPDDEPLPFAKESALRIAEAVGGGDISSADVNAPETSSLDERNIEYSNAPLSPMFTFARSLRSSEDSTNDGPTQTEEVRRNKFSTRSWSAVFKERSPKHASVPGAAAAAMPMESTEGTPRPSPYHYRGGDSSAWQSTADSAPAYFARALGCLPPAGEDGRDGSQRCARLSLLMGARMFTEACRLLRARAWEGPGGRWRDDPGAADAWSTAMRLLDALRRAAAGKGEREEEEEDEAAAADASGMDARGVLLGAVGGSSEVFHGGFSLQFRLAFEDSLTETVLADSPDRMEMVMSCRPSDLDPISVVRMVRRAVAAATATAGDPCSGGGKARVVGDQTGEFGKRAEISASARTLKRCLLLLFEDGQDIPTKRR